MDGDEVAKILKKDEALKSVPIILMSATTKILTQRARESGVDGWLTKPFESNDLIAKIQKLLIE